MAVSESVAAGGRVMHVGEEWRASSNGESFVDLNPYTGEAYAHFAAGTREDAARAVRSAAGAFPGCAAPRSIEDFTQLQWVSVQSVTRGFAF